MCMKGAQVCFAVCIYLSMCAVDYTCACVWLYLCVCDCVYRMMPHFNLSVFGDLDEVDKNKR